MLSRRQRHVQQVHRRGSGRGTFLRGRSRRRRGKLRHRHRLSLLLCCRGLRWCECISRRRSRRGDLEGRHSAFLLLTWCRGWLAGCERGGRRCCCWYTGCERSRCCRRGSITLLFVLVDKALLVLGGAGRSALCRRSGGGRGSDSSCSGLREWRRSGGSGLGSHRRLWRRGRHGCRCHGGSKGLVCLRGEELFRTSRSATRRVGT
mmetsp:Transcript_36718/g.63362  ORF Transcript_36718/g.63362 Transcript_36718/m.63362 type:complete len:205 (+) Transcript_36718:738-1352(+)